MVTGWLHFASTLIRNILSVAYLFFFKLHFLKVGAYMGSKFASSKGPYGTLQAKKFSPGFRSYDTEPIKEINYMVFFM